MNFVIKDPLLSSQQSLDKQSITIGKSVSCDIHIKDKGVKRSYIFVSWLSPSTTGETIKPDACQQTIGLLR